MRVVRDAEAAATRAQQEAEEAAAEAALAAARGTMSEVDAAQHARRAQQAAQLSRPYTVGEQVGGGYKGRPASATVLGLLGSSLSMHASLQSCRSASGR